VNRPEQALPASGGPVPPVGTKSTWPRPNWLRTSENVALRIPPQKARLGRRRRRLGDRLTGRWQVRPGARFVSAGEGYGHLVRYGTRVPVRPGGAGGGRGDGGVAVPARGRVRLGREEVWAHRSVLHSVARQAWAAPGLEQELGSVSDRVRSVDWP